MARVPFTPKQRFEILRRDKFRCQYCGACGSEVQLHVDHVVPVVEGGANTIDNLRTACSTCNLGKHSAPLFSYDAFFVAMNRRDGEACEAALVDIACSKYPRSERAWAQELISYMEIRVIVHAIEISESWRQFVENCYRQRSEEAHAPYLPAWRNEQRLSEIDQSCRAMCARHNSSRSALLQPQGAN